MMKLSIFLLWVLSVTVNCKDPQLDGPIDNFQNQHIIEGIPEGGCDDLIRIRKIKDNNNKCKIRNTFINSTFENVKDICHKNNSVYDNDNLYKSPANMTILHCKLSSEKNENTCKYNGTVTEKQIEIACNNDLQPVHMQCCF